MAEQREQGGRWEAVQTLCVLIVCGVACFRAIVGFEPFPWWNSDPFESQVLSTGVRPAGALWLDVAALVASSVGLAGFVVRGGRVRWWLVGLGVVGGLSAAVWMARPTAGNELETGRLALAWGAAVWSAVALAHLCGDVRRRTLAMALLLGLVGMLAAKGVVQVVVEHADTVAWYERDPEAFLRAHGWEPGSAAARGYERRLYQTEATGWFGLSNVYATVMAGTAVGLLAMGVVGAIERRRVGAVAAVLIGGVLGAMGLWLCHSKGGVAAALGGALGVGVAWWAGQWSARWSGRRTARRAEESGQEDAGRGRRLVARIGMVLAAGLALAPMAAVVVRGIVGERIGELSLLFRSFYMRGAVEVVGEHWWLGVGPAGFRDAYMRVRGALAVEDVVSPHSLMWDLVSGFGVIGGGAWYVAAVGLACGAVVGWMLAPRSRDGHAEDAAIARASDGAGRDDVKMVALAAIVATAVAASIERALTTPETAVLRVVGLAAWVGVAWGVVALARQSRRGLAGAGLGAAAVLVLHSGIEVTPTWVGAQTWFFAVLGVAGGAWGFGDGAARGDERGVRGARGRVGVCIGLGGWTALLLAVAPWSVIGWERRLREAWVAASDVGRVRDELRVLEIDPALAARLGVSFEGVRREVARMVEQAPATSPARFEGQLDWLTLLRAGEAERALAEAVFVGGVPTGRSADRAAQRRAMSYVATGDRAGAISVVGQAIARFAWVAAAAETSLGWSHLGSMQSVQAELFESAGSSEAALSVRRAAVASYARAAALDPRGVHHPLRLARLSVRIGDAAGAAEWARRAIENDENARLDPLMGLSEGERAEMEGLARGG